jgi:hypothetical protein
MGGTRARASQNGRRTGIVALGLAVVLLLSTACGSPALDRPEAVVAAATTTPTPTPTATPKPTRTPTPTPTPVITVEDLPVVEAVAFEVSHVDDAALASGSTTVGTAGVAGERTTVFRVTYTDGVETGREQVSSEVTRQPVTEVVRVGTYVARPPPPPAASAPVSGGCDPNYSGCVPIASDVDCEGGSGNGPAYVRGPVTVIGSDIYGLDNDSDGVGCES